MSYSGMGKALLLTVALSACAGSATQTNTSSTPARVEAGGSRTTDGPTFRSAFLAGESHRPSGVEGGQVVVEYSDCDVWGDTRAERCDLSRVFQQSMTPGYQP